MSEPRTAEEHSLTVLAGILPDRRDRLHLAMRYLSPAHIPAERVRNLLVITDRYAELTGAVITEQALVDMVGRQSDAGTLAHYQELYKACAAAPITDGDFRWAVEQLRELAAINATAQAIHDTALILRSGLDVGKNFLNGHVDARNHILTKVGEIEAALRMQDAPEGDIRTEGKESVQDYVSTKQKRLAGLAPGINFGIDAIDNMTGGLQSGELDLLVAYSSDGKTTMSVQLAWHAAVMQGLNVFFATSETLRPQVRRRLIARHSRMEHFEIPDGLDSNDLKRGSLPEAMEPKLVEVVRDLEANPSYGKLYVAQVPRGSTVKTVEARVARANASWKVDLTIIDYLALLKPDRPRQSPNAELSDIIKEAKQFAATFDDGRGVCTVSPWQVSRTAWMEALKSGHYTMACLSDTSEAEKSSDIIISILRAMEDAAKRQAEVKAQILKNRDGSRMDGAQLMIDYATSYVRSLRAGTMGMDLLGDGVGLDLSAFSAEGMEPGADWFDPTAE